MDLWLEQNTARSFKAVQRYQWRMDHHIAQPLGRFLDFADRRSVHHNGCQYNAVRPHWSSTHICR